MILQNIWKKFFGILKNNLSFEYFPISMMEKCIWHIVYCVIAMTACVFWVSSKCVLTLWALGESSLNIGRVKHINFIISYIWLCDSLLLLLLLRSDLYGIVWRQEGSRPPIRWLSPAPEDRQVLPGDDENHHHGRGLPEQHHMLGKVPQIHSTYSGPGNVPWGFWTQNSRLITSTPCL